LREGYKEERSACINRIRGLLTEFGLVFPKRPETLRRVLIDVLEDASNELTGLVRVALQRAHAHWVELDAQLAWCDQQIDVHVKTDVRAKMAVQLQGIGPSRHRRSSLAWASSRSFATPAISALGLD
jgi:transposase